MSRGRPSRAHRVAVLLALLPVLTATSGCGGKDEGAIAEAEAPAGPATPEELERLVVDAVPSMAAVAVSSPKPVREGGPDGAADGCVTASSTDAVGAVVPGMVLIDSMGPGVGA